MNNEEPVLISDRKYLWIALAFLPIFFIPGMILEVIVNGDKVKLFHYIGPLILCTFFIPLYYSAFNRTHKNCGKVYANSKINWQRWDKRGKHIFVIYQLLRVLLLSILGVTPVLLLFYLYYHEFNISILFFLAYIAFADAIIKSNILWDMRQLMKITFDERE